MLGQDQRQFEFFDLYSQWLNESLKGIFFHYFMATTKFTSRYFSNTICFAVDTTLPDHPSLVFTNTDRSIEEIDTLRFDCLSLTAIPVETFQCINLTTLDLSKNKLSQLPYQIGKLVNLKRLVLSGNRLSGLPADIGNLTSLTHLDCSANKLTFLPWTIQYLTNLNTIEASSNRLRTLPEGIEDLTLLHTLHIPRNEITELPDGICNLKALANLGISVNNLKCLPEHIGDLKSLTNAIFDHNHITELPKSFASLALKSFNFQSNDLHFIPENLSAELITIVDISNNIHLNESFFDALSSLHNLTHLFLRGIRIRTIPPNWFLNFLHMSSLCLGSNPLEEIPWNQLSQLSKLRYLDLSSIHLLSSHFFSEEGLLSLPGRFNLHDLLLIILISFSFCGAYYIRSELIYIFANVSRRNRSRQKNGREICRCGIRADGKHLHPNRSSAFEKHLYQQLYSFQCL